MGSPSRAYKTLINQLFCLCLLSLGAAQAAAETAGYSLGPIPEWVKPIKAFDPDLVQTGEDSHGFHSRLHDFQFNGINSGKSERFSAIEYTLTNRYGVENYSNIDISFDPSYEQLNFHELTVKRGEQLISKLETARFDLLRTERDRSELIYDGTRTLAILLDDIRPGDKVRYSYTLSGENPIYQGHREFRIHTELWTASDRQFSRILTASDKPLNRRVRGADVPMLIKDENGVQEIIVDQLAVPEFSIEENVPRWHYNRGTIVFSDMKDWRSVVEWLYPMYELPDVANSEIATIASVIRSAHEDPRQQIGAALRWVQDEIRYFGVELGKNSHWPSRPEQTLARRFGDCKDKALLLIALLKELGVEAQPALVNTRRGLEAANYPYRMHAFDHVIVHIQFNDVSHFIDPTRTYQAGALGELHEPDYGLALILTPEATGLTEMGSSRSRYALSVNKTMVITPVDSDNQADADSADNAYVKTQPQVSLLVETAKRGRLAENVRYSLETDGLTQMGESYLDYYRHYFSSVEAIDRPSIDDSKGDHILISEQYAIEDFWNSDENVDRYRWLYADEIIAYLDKPEQTLNRQQPYRLVHPIAIDETWKVSVPENLKLDQLDAVFKNDWMSFSKESTLSEDGKNLVVTFRYQSLANEVAARDIQQFADSVEKITDLASFYLEDQPTLGAAIKTAAGLSEAGAVNGMVLCLGILLWMVFYLFRVPVRYEQRTMT